MHYSISTAGRVKTIQLRLLLCVRQFIRVADKQVLPRVQRNEKSPIYFITGGGGAGGGGIGRCMPHMCQCCVAREGSISHMAHLQVHSTSDTPERSCPHNFKRLFTYTINKRLKIYLCTGTLEMQRIESLQNNNTEQLMNYFFFFRSPEIKLFTHMKST